MKHILRKIIFGLISNDEYYHRLIYFLKFKKKLNIKNPKTTNDKLFKLMLTQDNYKLSRLADKFLVRDYVKSMIGEKHLIPLIDSAKDEKCISKNLLNHRPFIIKTNHLSGPPIKIVTENEDFNIDDTKKKFRRALNKNHYNRSREPHYKNIKPRIIIEKLLIDDKGKIPMDFKFHVFNGKVKFIQVDIDRFSNHTRNFFSTNWELLPFQWSPIVERKLYKNSYEEVSPPKNLEMGIKLSEKLSSNMPYCRVDLYNIKGHYFFGEITFYPGAALEFFSNSQWDKRVADFIEF